MAKITLVILFSFFVLSGCENLNDTGEIDIHQSVFIDLSVNRKKQEFLIYETLSINDPVNEYPFGSRDNYFIDDALITLIDESGSEFSDFILQLKEPSYTSRKYFTNNTSINIKPNSNYQVVVQVDDELVTGNVKTLERITGFSAELFETSADEPLNGIANWNNIKGASYYELITTYFFNNNDSLGGLGSVSTHKEILTLKENYSEEFKSYTVWDWDSLKVSVIAYDENIYKHFFEHNHKVNIENAFGYIGSSSAVDTTVILK